MSRFSPGFLRAVNGNDQFTKVLLHLDGNLNDVNAGGSSHTWTAHGSSFVTSGQRFGSGALQCPYIDTPANSDFNLGSGDWAVDFVFDTLGLGNGASRNLTGQNPASFTFGATSFFVQITSANKLTLTVSSGSSFTTVTGTTSLTSAGLHQAQVGRAGNVLRLFLDGVQEGGDVSFSATIPSSTNALSVGRSGEYSLETFAGIIDEYRLSVGSPRNTADFTPPTSAYS